MKEWCKVKEGNKIYLLPPAGMIHVRLPTRSENIHYVDFSSSMCQKCPGLPMCNVTIMKMLHGRKVEENV